MSRHLFPDRVGQCAAALFLSLTFFAAANGSAAVSDAQLNGRWKMVEMRRNGASGSLSEGTELEMHFEAKTHSFSVSVRAPKSANVSEERGTFHLNGEVLTTTSSDGKRTEQMRVRLPDSNTLELRKQAEILVLRRL